MNEPDLEQCAREILKTACQHDLVAIDATQEALRSRSAEELAGIVHILNRVSRRSSTPTSERRTPSPRDLDAIAREILQRAISDTLVTLSAKWADPSPQVRTPEELQGVTEILLRFARQI